MLQLMMLVEAGGLGLVSAVVVGRMVVNPPPPSGCDFGS